MNFRIDAIIGQGHPSHEIQIVQKFISPILVPGRGRVVLWVPQGRVGEAEREAAVVPLGKLRGCAPTRSRFLFCEFEHTKHSFAQRRFSLTCICVFVNMCAMESCE